MELENYQEIALYGFLGATLFGFMANRTNFCIMGAISDWINIGSKTRYRIWMLSIGVAMLATQLMQALGLFDLQQMFYLSTNFTWIGYILGGFLFGVGMTMGSGCAQRTLVRVGGGNLKSLVLLLVLAATAYMTLRGILAYFRVDIINAVNVDLTQYGLADQSIPGLISHFTGIDQNIALTLSAGILGVGTIIYALKDRDIRTSLDNQVMGILVGLLVAGGWYVTGVIGFDDFGIAVLPNGCEEFLRLNYTVVGTGASVGTVHAGLALDSVKSDPSFS